MKFEVELITPTKAANYLELNHGNFRNVDHRRVTHYSKEMHRGRWEMNGEAIKFGNGCLLDGQHRLLAVLESGCSVPMLVIKDVACSASTIDRGKPRSVGQWLSHLGVKNCTNVAAASRVIVAYNKGLWGRSSWAVDAMTDSEIIDFAIDNQEKINDAVNLAKCSKFGMSTGLAAIFFIGSGSEFPSKNKTCSWFSKSLATGADLCDSDPVLHLRNRLVSGFESKANKLSPYMERMLTTIAWNKTVIGEPVKVLKWATTGPAKQDPPQVVLVAK